MPALRNIRHEKFVREYLKCDFNASEAYRRVYPRHRPDIACVSACQLLRRPKVRERLQEVQAALIKRSDITVDRILTEYEDARQLAIAQEKPEAMLNASEKKAKLVGLLVDRREVGNVGDFEQMTDISQILEKVRQEAGLEAAEALAKAFGLDANPNEAQPNGDDLDPLEPPTGSMN
jgi:Terminase small subunit